MKKVDYKFQNNVFALTMSNYVVVTGRKSMYSGLVPTLRNTHKVRQYRLRVHVLTIEAKVNISNLFDISRELVYLMVEYMYM